MPRGLPEPHTNMYGFYSPKEIQNKLNLRVERETGEYEPWYENDVWWHYVPDGAGAPGYPPQHELKSFGPNNIFRVFPGKDVRLKRQNVTGWDNMTRNEQAWHLINTYPPQFWMGRDPRAIHELLELERSDKLDKFPRDVRGVLSDMTISERNRRQWLRFWDRCRGDTKKSLDFIFEWMKVDPAQAMPLLAEGDLEMALTIASAVPKKYPQSQWSMYIPGKKQTPQRNHFVARLYPDSISRGGVCL